MNDYKESQTKATPPSVQDTLAAAFARGKEIGDFTEYQQLLAQSKSPTAAKTPTLDELQVEAILSGNWDAALTLWNFANMPSQKQRLDQAIAVSQSPADYLSVVGMMRGEIPITGAGSASYRIGPDSQAFSAFGVNGPSGGDIYGQNPLEDPALRPFIESRNARLEKEGGGTAGVTTGPGQGVATGAGGASIKPEFGVDSQAMDRYQAQLDAQRNQHGADGLTTEERIRRQAGLQNPNGTNNNVPTAPFATGQNPALDAIDRQIQGLVSAGDAAETPEEQQQIQQRMNELQEQRQQTWLRQQQPTVTPTRPDVKGEGNMLGVYDKAGTLQWVNGNDQESIAWARNFGGTASTAQPGVSDTRGAGGAFSAKRMKSNGRTYDRQPDGSWVEVGRATSVASTSSGGGMSDLPSFLKDTYGSEILAGSALKQRMSYPELASQMGKTLPRFRSAQARQMQTPLEQRMFEAGLKIQGVDLPTFLAQERAGTTPGGSRRRRIQTVSR